MTPVFWLWFLVPSVVVLLLWIIRLENLLAGALKEAQSAHRYCVYREKDWRDDSQDLWKHVLGLMEHLRVSGRNLPSKFVIQPKGGPEPPE